MVEQDLIDAHENLVRLIVSTSSELARLSHQARDYLIFLVKDGQLEQKQTTGSIERWSEELLKKLHEGGGQDATR